MSVVGDIETIQIRQGDVIVLKPKAELTDARMQQIIDQLRTWIDYRRIKVHIAIMPHDCDLMIIREDKKP